MARGGMERVKVGGCEAHQTFTHTPSVTRSILKYTGVHRGIVGYILEYIEVYWSTQGYTGDMEVHRSILRVHWSIPEYTEVYWGILGYNAV